MSIDTSIEWARHPDTGLGASWNPLLVEDWDTGKVGYHCEHVTEACRFCYAEGFNRRNLPARGTGLEFKPGHRAHLDPFLDEKVLFEPLKWKEPRGIFVCSMTDLFGEWVDPTHIDKMFAVMSLTPQHVYFVLTKRPAKAAAYTSGHTRMLPEHRVHQDIKRWQQRGLIPKAPLPKWPLPNVWLGTSVHDQESADKFVPELLSGQAARFFVSAEPLLGPINFRRLHRYRDLYLDGLTGGHFTHDQYSNAAVHESHPHIPLQPNSLPRPFNKGLSWIIAGGESGPKARPTNPQWFRDLRDTSNVPGVSFFFKQWGEWVSVSEVEGVTGRERFHTFEDHRSVRRVGKGRAGRTLDGYEHNDMPSAAP